MATHPAVLGWDIGGVNTKVARLHDGSDGPALRSTSLPFEVKRGAAGLGSILEQAARSVGGGPGDWHAVTMTAELSQAFRTKREGVGSVLDALESAFPDCVLHVYTVDGGFLTPAEARGSPLAVSAANWAATAALVSRSTPTCVLVDIGTTSTDIIPIVDGRIVAQGRTDPERLLSGELVYTGALRTPVEALAREVPLWGGSAGVAADGFAVAGDVYLWLERLQPGDYTCPTPDGRPPTRESAGDRLARVVCGDREMIDDRAIDDIATALARAQTETVGRAIERVLHRCRSINTAVVTGLGDFVAAEAATALGLEIVPLAGRMGDAARTAPAAAVAWLLWTSLEKGE